MNKRHPLRTTLAAATAVALAGGLLTLAASPAPAVTAKFADDFNGDGYRDLVTAAPNATVGGAKYAGAIVVNYGSASGISASHRKVVTQNFERDSRHCRIQRLVRWRSRFRRPEQRRLRRSCRGGPWRGRR
ncbi:FG-GAP repeat protein [Streptomyces sp. Midd1]|uniref:FG-GAP repeat protein n=1 Tax=Streptomyces sp. Midd3 TaxID=3161191 RepID=UPI0034DABBB4